jgi:hypothetical protein
MSQKTCFKCGISKPLSEFYPHSAMSDGYLGKCKECTKKGVRDNRASHRVQYSKYDRARLARPERQAQRRESKRKSRVLHPEKIKARMAVTNAIRDGRLVRGRCEYCGTDKQVQAHHDDYSRPLDVRWQCFKCHRERSHGQVVVAYCEIAANRLAQGVLFSPEVRAP